MFYRFFQLLSFVFAVCHLHFLTAFVNASGSPSANQAFNFVLDNGKVHEDPLRQAQQQQLTEITLALPGVRTDQVESYLCTAIRINVPEDNYIVKFIPRASHHNVHHMILYGCSNPGMQGVWNCGAMHSSAVVSQYPLGPVCDGRQTIMYAWAMDAPELQLPDGVGFDVGGRSQSQYLVLQVHYTRPLKEPDFSGITAQLTSQQLPKRAGIMLLSTSGRILAHQKERFESICPINDNIELHPFAFRVHTHRLGKLVSGYVVSNGRWSLIGKRDPQEPQMFYPTHNSSIVVRQGDSVAARCTMENIQDTDVSVGPTSNDEMCNYYVMYWVYGDSILSRDWCTTAGPPLYYWSTDSGLSRTNIPDFDASNL